MQKVTFWARWVINNKDNHIYVAPFKGPEDVLHFTQTLYFLCGKSILNKVLNIAE